jgi:DNA invertase Pin-like site-specific DNA recombinase
VKAVLYLRVSMIEQSTENQLPDLEALASRRGFNIVATYAEKVSAVKTRPEFDKMIASAHRGKFDVLLVWNLDRLHRSIVGALQTVLDLDRRGVQIISYKEPWLDTGGPVRGLLIGIFGWVAEQERLRIGDRTRAGLERARRRGGRLGRPRVDLDMDRLMALRAGGMSMSRVAAELERSFLGSEDLQKDFFGISGSEEPRNPSTKTTRGIDLFGPPFGGHGQRGLFGMIGGAAGPFFRSPITRSCDRG